MSPKEDHPKIGLKIITQKGICEAGHRVGQEFDVSAATPAGLCPGAYHSAMPTIFAMKLGARIPWAQADGAVHIACPDPENPVVMRIGPLG